MTPVSFLLQAVGEGFGTLWCVGGVGLGLRLTSTDIW